MTWRFLYSVGMTAAACSFAATVAVANPTPFEQLGEQYASHVRPLVARYCLDCHSAADPEGELDLERFAGLADVRGAVKIWLKVAEMLANGEMPPKDAPQPSADESKQLRAWVERYLDAEATASAGDPGPVILRRLSNAQYTYTACDLTGVAMDPLREFPSDGAAGEGFTNTGSALVMSPSLLTKYLDAGKAIADHAVPLPDGFRFSTSTTRRDWTNEILGQIRQLYLDHCDPQRATKVNLQGLTWESNDGGRLPIENYLEATLAARDALVSGHTSLAAVAADRKLNAKYLATLWATLISDEPSQLLDTVRKRWRAAGPTDAKAITEEIAGWQKVLTRFQSVGHMKSWMVPANPLVARQEIRQKLTRPVDGGAVTLYLVVGDAGDGAAGDTVEWRQPRLIAPGRPDLLLRDVREFTREISARRARIFADTARSLIAVDQARRATGPIDGAELARLTGVDPEALAAWMDFFGVQSAGKFELDHFQQQINKVADYEFVRGWGRPETPELLANSSDQHVRIPGNMKPHGVVVHPSPALRAVVGWQSPVSGLVRIEAKVTHAHPECGNGVTWALELRRGNTRQVLGSGTAAGNSVGTIGPVEQRVSLGDDLISLAIGPRDGNHACDLTDLEFVITSLDGDRRQWSLTADVSGDVLAANPHADRFGNAGVWHFYTEPGDSGATRPAIPTGSLLARWQAEERPDEKRKLADQVQSLLVNGPPADAKHPDALLYQQLASLGGPLFARTRPAKPAIQPAAAGENPASSGEEFGLEPSQFGRHPNSSAIDPTSLCVQAPSIVEIRLPADLAADAEFVATAVLNEATGAEGSAQPLVVSAKPTSLTGLRADAPVLVADSSAARRRFENACDDFRRLFPAALCYIRIVPVDEVVTLTLFHREDEPLCRLMLTDDERAKLDRLWEELHFVSFDALTLVDAFAQLMEYATQDSDPKLFEPYRQPIQERAAAFRRLLVEAEPRQVDALVAFAARAYRHPLSEDQARQLRELYARLREQELPHDEALRFTLARIFVSPEFLYRVEMPAPGDAQGPVSDWELANRLSYFLWSSVCDAPLWASAKAGRLHEPDVLAAETRRMLRDGRVRRLAAEFACQWWQIYDLPALDEKSERHFPTFVALRGDMHEEAVRFFTDLVQRDGSVLEVFNADHTFLNEALARHYGIQGINGDQWRRVDGLRQYGRGGILGLAATLAKQSGASRTSPILRGNWVSEVLLGEKLPRPPKDVPQLPEDETATEGLTVRQLVERHTSDPKCASCHVRIDPLGYALEGFDAIGRRREKDLAGRAIDARASLVDGTQFDGLAGLREYLLGPRREAVVRQFNRKLLGYALGRGVQLSDSPLLDEMKLELERQNYRFSAVVLAIVRSRQFREIRGRGAQVVEAP